MRKAAAQISTMFALVGPLMGCAWLPDINRKLEARTPPTFLVLAGNSSYRPGTATNLPLRLTGDLSSLVPITSCGMTPIVSRNAAYGEPELDGTWFSDGTWIDLQDESPVSALPLVRELRNLSTGFVKIKVMRTELQVFVPNEVTRKFYEAHPTWKTIDYVRFFKRCPAAYSISGLHILHQVFVGHLILSFRNLFGLPLSITPEVLSRLDRLGFVPLETGSGFISKSAWAIDRTGRLTLSDVGFFRQATREATR